MLVMWTRPSKVMERSGCVKRSKVSTHARMAHMATTESTVTLAHRLKNGNRVSILAGIVSLIAVCSLFFHPRVQAMLFPAVRLAELTKLAVSTRASRSVDPFLFWQIRDEYGSGFFTLSSDHTIFRETQELLLPPKSEWIEFSTYHSALVESHDYLTQIGRASCRERV